MEYREKNAEGDKSVNILLDRIRRFSNSIVDQQARQEQKGNPVAKWSGRWRAVRRKDRDAHQDYAGRNEK